MVFTTEETEEKQLLVTRVYVTKSYPDRSKHGNIQKLRKRQKRCIVHGQKYTCRCLLPHPCAQHSWLM